MARVPSGANAIDCAPWPPGSVRVAMSEAAVSPVAAWLLAPLADAFALWDGDPAGADALGRWPAVPADEVPGDWLPPLRRARKVPRTAAATATPATTSAGRVASLRRGSLLSAGGWPGGCASGAVAG